MKLICCFVLFATMLSASVVTVCASGCTYALAAVQTAIDDAVSANDGRVIEINKGETVGALIMRARGSSPVDIMIRSNGCGALPDRRVFPADASQLFIVNAGADAAITTEAGASHYRFDCMKIHTTSTSVIYYLINLDRFNVIGCCLASTEIATQPHHIVFNRVLVDLPNTTNARQIFTLAGRNITISNSYLCCARDTVSNGTGAEAHTIFQSNGQGPFDLINNEIRGLSINFLYGGTPPVRRGYQAMSGRIAGNRFYRPYKYRVREKTVDPSGTCLYDSEDNIGEYWRNTSTPSYWRCESGTWVNVGATVYNANVEPYFNWQKNLFEYKEASGQVVDGNTFENAWSDPIAQSQHGAAWLHNQVDNYGTGIDAQQASVRNITYTNNRIKNTAWLMSNGALGTYFYNHLNIRVRNNVAQNIGNILFSDSSSATVEPVVFQVTGTMGSTAATGLDIVHNTIISGATTIGRLISFDYAVPASVRNMRFTGNIADWMKGGLQNTVSGAGSLWNAVQGSVPSANGLDLALNAIPQTQTCTIYGGQCILANLYDSHGDGFPDGFAPGANTRHPNYTGVTGDAWYTMSDLSMVDLSGGDYRLGSGSAWKKMGPLGKDPGADIDIVDWSTANNVDGLRNPYLDFQIKSVMPGQTTATVYYSAYSTATCTVAASLYPDYSSTTYSATDSGGATGRTASITGLTANRRYFVRIVCGGTYRRETTMLTRP